LGDSLPFGNPCGERDSFASREFGLVEHSLIIKDEYRQRVEAKVLEIFETHPTIAAIGNGEAVTDLQLVALGRSEIWALAYIKARLPMRVL